MNEDNYGFRNTFKCESGGSCYFIQRVNGRMEAIYHYAPLGVYDKVDWTQSVEADTWNELVRKLEEKHPAGWHWE